MSNKKPEGVYEFPLTEGTARRIINDLAENHTNRIRWSSHVKDQLAKRGVTTRQILNLLKSRRSVFREGPYEVPNGDWKFNLRGMAAGTTIELVVAITNHHEDPSSTLVTVWFN